LLELRSIRAGDGAQEEFGAIGGEHDTADGGLPDPIVMLYAVAVRRRLLERRRRPGDKVVARGDEAANDVVRGTHSQPANGRDDPRRHGRSGYD
jgi:hypothetical protein